MITYLAALLLVQAPTVHYQVGVAVAPGNQFGPVVRLPKAWPIMAHLSFQLEPAFAFTGTAGTNTGCDFAQCYARTVELHAWEFELPTLLVVSVGTRGTLFFTGGPLFALRFRCGGNVGGTNVDTCSGGSDLAWGGAIGVGVAVPAGSRRMTLEARLQQFETPLAQMSITDAGATQPFRARAVTVTVGW